MPRVSRKEAEQHREDVINAASRLFLEHGIDGVSVPAVMAEAGLTHGGFYGHFSSKEALVAEACTRAFEDRRSVYEGIGERNGLDKKAARVEFIKRYTAKTHRDAIGLGCPAAAMCGDIVRDNPKGPVRAAFAAGLNMMIEKISPLLSGKRKPRRVKKRWHKSRCWSAGSCSRDRRKGIPFPTKFCSLSGRHFSKNK